MAKEATEGFVEVDYYTRDLTPGTVNEIKADVTKRLVDGWKLVFTNVVPVGNTSFTVIHVFAR